MNKRFRALFLCSMILASAVSAETLAAGKAYVVSSINVNSGGNVGTGESFSLVPQVVVATGKENYVGSVSTFTGRFNEKRYEAGTEKGNCLTSVINNLTSTSTTDALSAAQGKILNDKIANTYTKSEVDAKIASSGVNKNEILDLVYPVGSIYMSASNLSPSTFLGGEWTALDEGRVLIGANSTYTAGSKGGEAEHTLTVGEMPSHDHQGRMYMQGGTNWSGQVYQQYVVFSKDTHTWDSEAENLSPGQVGYKVPNESTPLNHTTSLPAAPTDTVGYSQPHNNMQPYLAVYMWKRTA